MFDWSEMETTQLYNYLLKECDLKERSYQELNTLKDLWKLEYNFSKHFWRGAS
jgi:hypothetical protein